MNCCSAHAHSHAGLTKALLCMLLLSILLLTVLLSSMRL